MATDAPRRLVQPLRLVATLSDEKFQELIAAMSEIFVGSNQRGLERKLADSLGVDLAETRTLIGSLFGFISAISTSDTPDDLPERMAASPNLELDDAARANLASRLSLTATNDAVLVAAKAQRLQNGRNGMITSTSIVTDVRPVFARDVDTAPHGFVVSHALSIRWEDQGDDASKTTEFIMDRADLQELKDQVERALRKQTAVVQWLQQTSAKLYLDRGEGE